MKEPIRKITLAGGTVRYRLVVDIGRDETGKRNQLTRTFDRLRDARAELSRIRHQANDGTYVQPSKITVNQYLDEYLVGATRNRRASTKANYRDALKPVRAWLGDRPLQSITKADIEQLVDWMLTAGRKRSGKPGTGLGARSVRLTLGRLRAAFEMAVDEGKLVRNVARLVTPARLRAQRARHLVSGRGPGIPASRHGRPAARGMAAQPLRPAPWRGARPALVGYRPEGKDAHGQSSAGSGRLQGSRRATQEPQRQAHAPAR